MRRFLADPAMAQRVVNWPEIAWAAAAEITLNELRIELSYPLDKATEHFFKAGLPRASESAATTSPQL